MQLLERDSRINASITAKPEGKPHGHRPQYGTFLSESDLGSQAQRNQVKSHLSDHLVVLRLQDLQLLFVTHGLTSCSLLVLPQEDLPRKASVARHSSDGSPCGNCCVTAAGSFALCLCSVYECRCGHIVLRMLPYPLTVKNVKQHVLTDPVGNQNNPQCQHNCA